MFENINYNQSTSSRIGKPNSSADSSKPVVVKLQLNNDVLHILRNRERLPDDITASSHRTQLLWDHFLKLKLKVDKNNSTNPNDRVEIKFTKSIPSMSKIDPKTTFRESTSNEQ